MAWLPVRTLVVFLIIAATASAQTTLSHIKFEAESGTLSGGASVQSDSNARGGSSVAFSQASQSCGAGQVGTPPNCFNSSQALGVNAGSNMRPFNRSIKGIGLANWTFTKPWGKPYVGQIQGLKQAIQAIDPGLIRYAGGLWANYVGFDRNRADNASYSDWTSAGHTYSFNYGTNELADLDAFAKSVNAEVMIQVNISQNDPAMWADLVRYAKERGFTSFKYYELGNEIDLEVFQGNSSGMSPDEYANRARAYQQAMLAVDPNIQIIGGVPAGASDIIRTGWSCCGNDVSQYITKGLAASRAAGKDWGAASFHWYQGGGDEDATSMFRWSWPENYQTSSGDWWRNSYARIWSEGVGPWIRDRGMSGYANTKLGISELGVSSVSDPQTASNANHAAAIWYSDVLGRLAYNGIDWVTQWDSYAAGNEYFSLIYPNSDQTTTPTLNLRPTYYAYVMYKEYFGDQMVQSSTYDPSKLSIWASRDSDDPGKLKLRITNVTGSPITTPIALNGFNATSGQAYTLSSTNPLDKSASSVTSTAPTTINGVKLNGMNVASSLASVQPTSVNVSGTSFNYTIPAYSSVAIVLNGSF